MIIIIIAGRLVRSAATGDFRACIDEKHVKVDVTAKSTTSIRPDTAAARGPKFPKRWGLALAGAKLNCKSEMTKATCPKFPFNATNNKSLARSLAAAAAAADLSSEMNWWIKILVVKNHFPNMQCNASSMYIVLPKTKTLDGRHFAAHQVTLAYELRLKLTCCSRKMWA